jgi:hypothetical protein
MPTEALVEFDLTNKINNKRKTARLDLSVCAEIITQNESTSG